MPRNKFPEETRQKILDASLELFAEKGYEKTTILDIVGNMDGLTRGAFYHHFKSKEEVLDALSERIFYENNPFEKVQNEEGLTGLEKLQKAVFDTAAVEEADERYQGLMRIAAELLSSPHFIASQLEFNREIAAKYIQPLMEEGMADGSIAPSSAKWLAELLLLMMNIWSNPNISPGTAEETAEKLILIADIFDKLGCPLFDESSLEAAEVLYEMHYPEANFGELVDRIEGPREERERSS
ncbi:MAG: TetR/AcrR family transcriptional regulator [Coriobacteriia bacterium]|nr:TetR/AcrR family transcriptional regulator [Coriobacteriia bacterium]